MNKAQPLRNGSTWFLLGREPLLSAAELFSLLKIDRSESYRYQAPFLLLERNIEPSIMTKLGGTIKIGSQISADLSDKELTGVLKSSLSQQSGKIVFGISLYGKNVSQKTIEQWGKSLKKELKGEGRSVRYIFKNELTLSSVTVEKNGLTKDGAEFLVIANDQGRFDVAKTTAVQPFESFGARDFGRPGRDNQSGMLPPKLALMMINLAESKPDSVLLDPFCGSGTVITEAALQGLNKIVGTDLSEKAVQDTKNNLEWQKKQHPELESANITLKTADVKNLSSELAPGSIGAIATEPYLGKPLRGNEKLSDLEAQADELLNLYISAFHEFNKILKSGSKTVFIIPQFITRSLPITISDKLVSEIKKIGFEAEKLLPEDIFPSGNFIVYRRPDQRVAREIWRFTKR